MRQTDIKLGLFLTCLLTTKTNRGGVRKYPISLRFIRCRAVKWQRFAKNQLLTERGEHPNCFLNAFENENISLNPLSAAVSVTEQCS